MPNQVANQKHCTTCAGTSHSTKHKASDKKDKAQKAVPFTSFGAIETLQNTIKGAIEKLTGSNVTDADRKSAQELISKDDWGAAYHVRSKDDVNDEMIKLAQDDKTKGVFFKRAVGERLSDTQAETNLAWALEHKDHPFAFGVGMKLDFSDPAKEVDIDSKGTKKKISDIISELKSDPKGLNSALLRGFVANDSYAIDDFPSDPSTSPNNDIILATKNPNTRFAEEVGKYLSKEKITAIFANKLITLDQLKASRKENEHSIVYTLARSDSFKAYMEDNSIDKTGTIFEGKTYDDIKQIAKENPKSYLARGLFSRRDSVSDFGELRKLSNEVGGEVRNGLKQNDLTRDFLLQNAKNLSFEDLNSKLPKDKTADIQIDSSKVDMNDKKLLSVLKYFGYKQDADATKDTKSKEEALRNYALTISLKAGQDFDKLLGAKDTLKPEELKKLGFSHADVAIQILKSGVFSVKASSASVTPPPTSGTSPPPPAGASSKATPPPSLGAAPGKSGIIPLPTSPMGKGKGPPVAAP